MYNLNTTFNLRTKLIVGFTAFLIVATWINLMFLKDFDSFQKNVKMLTHTSNISNLCLEIRRYEKNFIIGKAVQDYEIVGEFIRHLHAYIDEIDQGITSEESKVFGELKNMIGEYTVHFSDLKAVCVGNITMSECSYDEPVQKLGAAIVTLAEGLVTKSQKEVETFAKESKIKLTLYFSFLIVFSLCGMLVFFITIGKRLKTLEKAANAIATGDYNKLPRTKLNDEVQIVFKAFDQMTEVLEERQELLFQAEKLSSIGTLASGMAHQLNNPLNNIATSCQLAMDEVKNPEDIEFLKKLLNTIEEETLILLCHIRFQLKCL